MKLKSIPSKIGVTLLILIAYACLQCSKTSDEPEPVVPAFPDQYCGNFAFTIFNYYYSSNPTSDTATYNGTITLIDRAAGKLEIRYNSGGNTVNCNSDSIWGAWIKPTIAETGQLDYPPANGCGPEQPFTGSFSGTDTVTFRMTTGGFWHRTQLVRGVRIK